MTSVKTTNPPKTSKNMPLRTGVRAGYTDDSCMNTVRFSSLPGGTAARQR